MLDRKPAEQERFLVARDKRKGPQLRAFLYLAGFESIWPNGL